MAFAIITIIKLIMAHHESKLWQRCTNNRMYYKSIKRSFCFDWKTLSRAKFVIAERFESFSHFRTEKFTLQMWCSQKLWPIRPRMIVDI